jgi:3'-phosphoadenosine 5'-phosphosulfate (PAPS) 3'-phosphatase
MAKELAMSARSRDTIASGLGSWTAEAETAIEAARRASAAIADIYDRAAAIISSKLDGSVVTDADLAADHLIRETLARHFADDALLTEESADDPARLRAARIWIVDPIDGTDQFVNRTGLFDVLIALVVGGRPVVGVAAHPPTGTVLVATASGGAWIEDRLGRRPIRFASRPPSPPQLAVSVWFGGRAVVPAVDRIAARLGGRPAVTITTNARPFDLLRPDRPYDALVGLIQSADQTSGKEWDFAAIDLIVREAGGIFSDLKGRPHRYNKPDTRNRGGILVAPDPETHGRLVDAIAPELPAGDW